MRRPRPRRLSSRLLAPLVVGLLTLLTSVASLGNAHAQGSPAAELRIEEGPVYAGLAVDVQVVVRGLDEAPQPEIRYEAPPGARLELLQVSPSVTSRVEIINGNRRQWRNVIYAYRFELEVDAPGPVELGPFEIVQGATRVTTPARRLNAERIPSSDEQHVRLVLPDTPLWIGQRTPLVVEWWVSEALAERIAGRRLHVPLFNRHELFRFEDPEQPDARMELSVESGGEVQTYRARARRERHRDSNYLVFSIERTLIPMQAGEFDLEPISMLAEEVMRWQRNVFGERIPTGLRRIRAEQPGQRVTVRAAPQAGRPASFSGAIGADLELRASADRTVVQVGDPITLTLTVRGDTLLETLALPDAPALGLDPERFRLSREADTGRIDGESKVFNLTLRVASDAVGEIPPLTLSWFDPRSGRYQTTRSAPIALSVRPGQVVSAADVERQLLPGEQAPSAVDAPAEPQPAAAAGATDDAPDLELARADLTVETGRRQLTAAPPWYLGTSAQLAAYGSGLLLLGSGLALRQRRLRDPRQLATQAALHGLRERIAAAQRVDELTAALREVPRLGVKFARAEHEALLADCEALAYAPGRGGAATPPPALLTRVRTFAAGLSQADA